MMAMFFAGMIDSVRAMLPMLERSHAESDDRWVRPMTKVVQGEVVQFVGDDRRLRSG